MGPPVFNAQVILIDESTGLPIDYLSTDENGFYEFTGIAEGDYSLYVDIAGITQQTTFNISITASTLEVLHLDYVVDAIWDFDINSVVNTSNPEIINILKDITIYPNPTTGDYIILQSELLDRQYVEIVIMSETGALLLKHDVNVVGDRIKLDLFGFIPGKYILQIKIEDEVQYKKIVVIK